MSSATAITPIFLILLWRRQLYGQRRFYAITNYGPARERRRADGYRARQELCGGQCSRTWA